MLGDHVVYRSTKKLAPLWHHGIDVGGGLVVSQTQNGMEVITLWGACLLQLLGFCLPPGLPHTSSFAINRSRPARTSLGERPCTKFSTRWVQGQRQRGMLFRRPLSKLSHEARTRLR